MKKDLRNVRSGWRGWRAVLAAGLVCAAAAGTAVAADGDVVTFVACAPGYPGTTAEAQSTMDALAAAIADAAGWAHGRVAATYHETDKGGVARMGQPDAGVVMVPLAFYLEHGDALKLVPRLAAVMQGGEESEVWSLVAKKGAVTGPASLDGWQVVSLAGFSPRFVRNVALGAWGALPAGASIVQGSQVLSALRKAAKGEHVAVLLDRTQAAAIGTLPFAADLEVVTKSAPLPANVVCTIDGRVSEANWRVLSAALLGLGKTTTGVAALTAVRMTRFTALDSAGLAAAKRAFGQ